MCGRFTLAAEASDLGDEFKGVRFPSQFAPRFNIAPTQPVLAIPNDGSNAADFMLWGLIPSWATDASIGARLINARGETLGDKPAFRGSYKYKRCLIPADGFYEWQSRPPAKLKIPHFVQLKSGRPFAFAGLWSEWQGAEGSVVRSCTIVTTSPNELMSPIHNRMPVILPATAYEQWLDQAARSPESLNGLIRPFPAESMRAYPVATLVNNPANDRRECILPA